MTTREPIAVKNGKASAKNVSTATGKSGSKGSAKRVVNGVVRDTVTEWDRLSLQSRHEIEQLVEVLKAVKQGDFKSRFEYQKDGILNRTGELVNDIIGL